jgi:pimeloyl-ACP methyl ester carboxylesterase
MSSGSVSGLRWRDCRGAASDEVGAELAGAGALCATVRVPLDHLRPEGPTVGIAISRIKADPAKRRGILLANPGGPGGPGIGYPLELRSLLGDVASQYDLIGFDPRFMGRSDPVDCGPVVLSEVFRSPPTRAAFGQAARLASRFAASCKARTSGVLRYASIREVARDMDSIRIALGEQRLSYYGVSWGADLGVVYSQLFGVRVDRLVVDSVTDVEGSEYHHLATGLQTEAAFDEWAAWAAWRDSEYHLGRTGMQVRAAVARLRSRTIRLGSYRIDGSALPWVLSSALGDEGDQELMARNVRTLIDAAAGKPVHPSEQLLGFLATYYKPSSLVEHFVAASFAFTCNDRGWPAGPSQYWRDAVRDRATQPLFATTILPCAYWADHTTEPELAIGNNTPMLIVQAARDNIPLRWAEALHRKLPGSVLHVVDRRAHGVYDARVPEVVSLVNNYLAG